MAQEVADRVYRLGGDLVSFFLIEDGGRLTLVDTGNPKEYDTITTGLGSLGKSFDDVDAIVLTHAHGDHLGSAARIKAEAGVSVHVHSGDVALARGEADRRHERHFITDLRHAHAWKALLFFLRKGATNAPPVADPSEFDDGEVIDVPGRPRVVFTPGHTDGSCCFELPERKVLFGGDSLVTLNIATGERGPRIMPGSFNQDSTQSLDALSQVEGLGADTLLPGHGEPWKGSMAAAVRLAREVGPS